MQDGGLAVIVKVNGGGINPALPELLSLKPSERNNQRRIKAAHPAIHLFILLGESEQPVLRWSLVGLITPCSGNGDTKSCESLHSTHTSLKFDTYYYTLS
jgi:hypothetical protein